MADDAAKMDDKPMEEMMMEEPKKQPWEMGGDESDDEYRSVARK